MDGQNSILSVVGPIAPNVASLRLVTQTLLAQQPWLIDPLVHEIPWRYKHEDEILENLMDEKGEKNLKSRLAFGVLRTDGIVNPTPPICRAVDIVIKALQSAGHEIIEWKSPSHQPIQDAGFKSWVFDGGTDVRSAFDLSGEPMSEQIKFYKLLEKEFTGSEIAATNVELRRLKKEYLDYWTSTVAQTGTGRPVDALICPLAPWPAARPGKYSYYGYSSWVNVLDYTSVVVPVTNVDKNVDRRNEDYTAIDDRDKMIQDDCK